MTFALRSRPVAVLAFLALWTPAALAQTGPWTERKYDPPVGSKWSIVSDQSSLEQRPKGEQRDQRVQMRAEMTVDEKLPDGFRVTYVNRGIEVSGNAPAAKLVGDAYGAMMNIPIRAKLDTAGRPVAVENLAEVKTAMRAVIDKIVAKFESNPKAAEFVRQMLQSLLDAEGRDAATNFMDELPQLAAVQNSWIKPGDVRRDTETTATPFGGATFKTTLTTRLDSYDEKTGKARFIRKREFEKDALREAVVSIVRRIAPVGDNKTVTPEMLEMMKKVNFSIEGETVYDTDNGMTVRIDDREFMSASVMGASVTKQQKKTVAVTRMN
jgi:hypothetical protein